MTQENFDASKYRLDTLVDPNLITETLLTSIPVQKPSRQQFIRVNPDPLYHYDTAVLELEQDRELYLVAGHMLPHLEGEYRRVRLCVAMQRHGITPFLWPLKLPQVDGRSNLWNDSALMAAEEAKRSWIRVVSDQQQGMYRTICATGECEEPLWPDATMEGLLEKAFRGKMIASEDHPVVKKLRGEL